MFNQLNLDARSNVKVRRTIATGILSAFLFLSVNLLSNAQKISSSPASLIMGTSFNPVVIKGIQILHDNPLRFDFIVDAGDSNLNNDQLRKESTKLIKYFLSAVTVPENDLWVNLSPYEEARIIPESFGQTDMGRDLLAQDYLLKQVTSSLVSPDNVLGKKFWDKIYAIAYTTYGTTDIPLESFNKIWIVPAKAAVYENTDRAFVIDAKFHVMVEEDYLALKSAKDGQISNAESSFVVPVGSREMQLQSTRLMRELIVPAIEKEVNEGRAFAQLRQIYYSLILAVWFKKNFERSWLGEAYVNKNKIEGINIKEKDAKETIYNLFSAVKHQTFFDLN